MVGKFLGLINKKLSGLHQAAILIGISSLASQVLGLFRDRLLAHYFGAGKDLDIYFAAFKVPDFLFNVLAPLVSVTVLLPFIIERLGPNSENKPKTLEFLNSVFTVFFWLIAVISVLAYILLPYLSGWVVPGFSPDQIARYIPISRILLLSPIFLGISNLYGSITQTFSRFYIYAISPILYNLGIICGILFFYRFFGFSGLAWGVVLGAFLQLIIQVPSVIKERLMPKFIFRIDWKAIKEVIWVAFPRTITLSSSALVFIVLVSLASRFTAGSISILQFSNALQRVPVIVVGVSYAVAAFPKLAKYFSAKEHSEFVNQVVVVAKHIIFWSLPITGLFVVLRAQIVRTILGSGAFNWYSTRLTAAALAIFVISAFAQSLIQIFALSYYASGNTKKPFIAALVASVAMIVSAIWFGYIYTSTPTLRFFFEAIFRLTGVPGTEVLVLPLAFSFGSIVNVFILWYLFKKDFPSFKGKVMTTIRHSLYATIIMGFVTYEFLQVFSRFFTLDSLYGVFMQGALSGIFGIIAGVFVLKLLKNEELLDLYNALHAKFWKTKPIQPTSTDTNQLSG